MIKYQIVWQSRITGAKATGEPIFSSEAEAWKAIELLAPIGRANGRHFVMEYFIATPTGQRLAQLALLLAFVLLIVLLSM